MIKYPLFVKLLATNFSKQVFEKLDLYLQEPQVRIQWQLFYDVDDLLGFGTHRLYNCDRAIKEYQVDTGDNPADAHTAYWNNDFVVERTTELLKSNSNL